MKEVSRHLLCGEEVSVQGHGIKVWGKCGQDRQQRKFEIDTREAIPFEPPKETSFVK